ncbi:hypothetical protein O181_069590 [Austropuccinia psidii MF-1]|uniref:Uncharacterized protein n=1 Tax=Austropuccinia psidii MF-1 TaxID=1389203 RepID=A0A9Q3EUS7_9BASI|nr:hypothetical protein [Austropuccinia psidii MF-1]
MVCTYKPVGQTQCNTSLFNSITNFSALRDKGIGPCPPSTIQSNEFGAINNPKCVYYIAGISQWVKWLLNIPNIETEIAHWERKSNKTNGVSDIQNSIAWKSFTWSALSPKDKNPL